MKIDLNSDLGEGFGRWKGGEDAELMKIISSANVACGFHAGDAVIMTRTVELAKANNVAIGAHVGLPDLLGFGRVAMDINPRDMQKHALYQLGALAAIAKVAGYKVTHANTHGAMGGMAKENPEYINLILDVFNAFDKELMFSGAVNSPGLDHARKLGMRTVGKIFADRNYDEDGTLITRKHPKALITDLEEVQARVSQFMHDSTIATLSGKRIKVDAKSILVHSDTPGAVAIAKMVRETVEKGGGQIVPFTELAD
ncbi:LamB/YcsF family protein [Bordetella ansorpii]|uniref:LamB/YcsF family protein n=1 Tax=Bordetella ansorpii TaxID=288768 RepID=A0A157P113_9BORD|nr:5-oxoprolinase subunit PxpA [Bordetella ansorpii]SAI26679.1 LamB/YcsF family protein [Bordetella ansorpii]